MSKSLPENYTQYVTSMKSLTTVNEITSFPKIIALYGQSDFLKGRSISSLQQLLNKFEELQTVTEEASALEQMNFRSMAMQRSLFDPVCQYVFRRIDKSSKLSQWLKEIKAKESIKNFLVFEFSDKIPAETLRQLHRLEALVIPCFEPSSALECVKVVAGLAKRDGVVFAEDALKLLADSIGPDLSSLYNEIQKITLIYFGRKEPIRATEIASIVGIVREDHVFELFSLLRAKQYSKAQLLIDQLIDRGEKSIALTGILARFLRENAQRNLTSSTNALSLCAQADIMFKSSRVSENIVLGRIIDAII